jgi:uncharacterized protein YeeX (DUF496 family)
MKTIAKALKEKNKLKKEISQLQRRLENHNSIVVGNQRPFDIDKIDQELNDRINQLIVLKSEITKGNQPIQEKIYRLGEIRGLIGFYKNLSVLEGKSTDRYSSDTLERETHFNEADIDVKVQKLEFEAEIIQDELELYNQITKI